MSYFRQSGNSIVPSEQELDLHEGPNAEEDQEEDAPFIPPTPQQRALAITRSLDLDRQLIAFQASF